MSQRSVPAFALASLLTACGGGGSDGPPTSNGPVSAGADISVATLEPVVLEARVAAGVEVGQWSWRQTLGPEVALAPGTDGELGLVAPGFAANLEFEVSALRPDGTSIGSDRALVRVEAPGSGLSLSTLATIDVRGGGEGRVSAAALHRASSRLFVIDRVANDVVVYDVSNPASPSFAGAFGPPAPSLGYEPGRPTAVAAGTSGAVAVTWTGVTTDLPGRLQLVDPLTLAELRSISTTGANPVDVAVDDDGSHIAVACAGDRTLTTKGDGRGYITLFEVPPAGAAAMNPHSDVAPIPFSAFDGMENQLRASGVRFFRPAPVASIDLVPRAVAIAPDGSRAWVACAENDCIVSVDVSAQLVREIGSLPDRVSGSPARGAGFAGSRPRWSSAPTFATGPAGDAIPFGGIQGIVSAATGPNGSTLRVVTGSGPTLAPVDLDGDGVRELPFVDPDAGLRVLDIEVDASGALSLVGEGLPLRDSNGNAVTGVPVTYPSEAGLAGHDERAVDLLGNPIPTSALGARLADATTGPNGELWFADSRRSSLWRFGANGVLIARYTPAGTPGQLGTPALPNAFRRRRVNLDLDEGRRFGGLAALAYHPGRGSVFAINRLPLDTPDTTDDAASRASRILRLVEFSLGNQTVVGEYVVATEGVEHAAEGLALGPVGEPFGGRLVLLEAGAEEDGLRALFRLDLAGATNLRLLTPGDYAAIDAQLETTAPSALGELVPPIVPVTKALALDLRAAGVIGGPSPSALAFDGDRLVVAHDDGWLGYASAPFNPASGAIGASATVRGQLTTGRARGLVFDTSVDGRGPVEVDFVPAVGLDGPTDIVAFASGGAVRVALANSGAPRIVREPNGAIAYDERVRADSLNLDTSVFPNAAGWQPDPFGGALRVSERDADLDRNGLADRLALFGSRSLSLVDAQCRTVWTSTPVLNERARAARPEAADAASIHSGIEPSALALVEVGGRMRLVAALRGVGLLSCHDLVDAAAPRSSLLAGTLSSPSSIAAYASGATAIIAVADATTGRVRIHRLAE